MGHLYRKATSHLQIPFLFLTYSFTNQIVKTSVKMPVDNPFSEEIVSKLQKDWFIRTTQINQFFDIKMKIQEQE